MNKVNNQKKVKRCLLCGSVVHRLKYSPEYPEYNFECRKCDIILHDKSF